MSDHDHSHHEHEHRREASVPPSPPEMREDAGSQALSEALRSSFAIVKVVMCVLVAVFLCSGFFTVGPQEKGIILRFGRPVGAGDKALLGAGLHWSFPYPIDEVVKIPITQIQRVTSTTGWYFTTPEKELTREDPPGPSLNPAVDGYAITGDGNIIHARATLTYRIEDPIRYEFDFVNASNAVQNALDNALLRVSAYYKADDMLIRDIAGFKERVQARVKELVENEKLGIVIKQCQVQTKAPRQLQKIFDQVLASLSTRDKVHQDALSYENKTLSEAAAETASRTNAAEAERVRLVGSVKAEAERFTALLPKYEANPQLFTELLLSEKIAQVLTNAQSKWYIPARADGKSREIRIQYNREPQKAVESSPNP